MQQQKRSLKRVFRQVLVSQIPAKIVEELSLEPANELLERLSVAVFNVVEQQSFAAQEREGVFLLFAVLGL